MSNHLCLQLSHKLQRNFLAGVNFERQSWYSIKEEIEELLTEEKNRSDVALESLINVILQSTVYHYSTKIFSRNNVLSLQLLEWLIRELQENELKIPDNLTIAISIFQNVLSSRISYKTYDDWNVTLLESNDGISYGTTGLTSWVGGAVLASWALSNASFFQGRRVLELGAGVGLTASVILQQLCPGPCMYVATDYHPFVLELLEHNLRLQGAAMKDVKSNFLDDFCQNFQAKLSNDDERELKPTSYSNSSPFEVGGVPVKVTHVDWQAPPKLPPIDVILGADVIYECQLISPIVSLIRNILETARNGNDNENERYKDTIMKSDERGHSLVYDSLPPVAYIACTRRSRSTIENFLEEVDKRGLSCRQVYQEFINPKTSLFFYQEAHFPVKIYEIVLK